MCGTKNSSQSGDQCVLHSEMGPERQNPIQRTVRTAHISVLMTVHNFSTYTIQHRTVLMISPLTSRETS